MGAKFSPMGELFSVVQFMRSVIRHWGSLVTSGAIIGAVGLWDAIGHHVPSGIYWAILIVGLFIAFYRAWNEERIAKEKAYEELATVNQQTMAVLEIRPSSGESLASVSEHGYTHYRMKVHNSGLETERIQVRLTKIEPLPISEYFRARVDLPYHVRQAHLADGITNNATSHDINPGTSTEFELLFFWESSDGRIMVDGIDTKSSLSRDARFQIEEDECWQMEYEISSTKTRYTKAAFPSAACRETSFYVSVGLNEA
jgi:hypothetical protein